MYIAPISNLIQLLIIGHIKYNFVYKTVDMYSVHM